MGGDQREDDFSGTPSPEPQVQQPPPPPQDVPKKVAVILGPGGGKTFAHVGVLKALQQQRIPIDKVVGLEWGALMGGLFATKGAVHDMEWKLYKMEQQNLPHPKGFFSRKSVGEESVNVMDGFLKEAFARDDLNGGKIPFICPARSIWTGVVNWQTRGAYNEAVKKCLTYPPVFKANGTFLAGASQATEAIERLVKEGFNVIIFVNVLGSAMPVAQDGLADHRGGIVAEGAIADERIAVGIRDVHHRREVHVETEGGEHIAFHAGEILHEIGIGNAAERERAGNRSVDPNPGDHSALLIDHQKERRAQSPACGLLQVAVQTGELLIVHDVAAKENQGSGLVPADCLVQMGRHLRPEKTPDHDLTDLLLGVHLVGQILGRLRARKLTKDQHHKRRDKGGDLRAALSCAFRIVYN